MAGKKDEAVQPTMSEETVNTAAAVYARGEEYVDFEIPLRGADDKPVFIAVNGESISVMPGNVVQVKRKFVEAYEHSVEQERAAVKAQAAAKARSRKALAEL